MTALLTATKRASVGDATDLAIYASLERNSPVLTEGVRDVIELNDNYSIELVVRQALLRKIASQIEYLTILEIGCGLSALGRKLLLPGCHLIEHDTKAVMEVRKRCLDDVIPNKRRTHIYYVAGDIRSPNVWKNISAQVTAGSGPLLVLCEGLMRYLDMTSKAFVAGEIRKLLRNDGTWLTCDVTLSEMIEKEMSEPDISDDSLAETVTKKQSRNAFISREECLDFFRNCGFSVEFFRAIDHLSAINNLLGQRFKANALRDPAKHVNAMRMTI